MLLPRSQSYSVVFALVALSLGLAATGAEVAPAVTFERDIRPILKTYCFECHGEGEKLKGGIDLRLRRLFANKDTDEGVVMRPGHPDQSLMLELVRSGQMPKGEKKVPEPQIALLERWIAAGAPTLHEEPPELPRGFQITEEERSFWAFQPIRRPPVPHAQSSNRIRTVIDAFIWDKLRERGLEFAPAADRLTLIRRVYFDLTGLPPSPEAVDAFLADDAPDAFERLVDRVLDSPAYGERWARHWLDAVGYADSNGYAEADSSRPHAWRYRDYVIRAFSADKPWNEFIVEQLAGDELAGVTQENAAAKVRDARVQELLTATGYLRMAPDGTGDEVADQNLARNQVLAETVKIVSSSLLGLTVGCAQCHDHRYDPISQKDYYRFRALFEPALDWKHWRRPADRLVSLYTEADREKAAAIEADARKLDAAANALRHYFLEQVFEKELAKIPEEARDLVCDARNTPRQKRSPDQAAIFKLFPSADVQGALDLYDPAAHKIVTAQEEKAGKLRATKPPEPFLMALTESAGQVPDTFVFSRGDHDQPKDKVEPGELEVIRLAARACGAAGSTGFVRQTLIPCPNGCPAAETSVRRLAYARWLTSGQHPLLARALVNRFWLHHFQRGLVGTPGDFGQLGERPSHPELLDWLASEFMDGGWRLKSFHRLLMTSTVYRQAAVNETAQRVDPDNHFFARMKPRRLEAESLRDSILSISGALNPEPFGPPLPIARDGSGRVVVGQQKTDGRGDPTLVEPIGPRANRRSIYVEVRRSLPLTVLEAFDEPVMSPNCEARVTSNGSPQALMMLNDTFVLEQSRRMAERLWAEAPGKLRIQIDRAWRLIYGSAPSEEEQSKSLVYLAEQAEAIRAHGAKLASEISKHPEQKPKPSATVIDPQLQALASLCQALFSANRFLYVD